VEPAVLALPAERALQPTAPGVTWPAADGGALAERRTSARAAWVVTPNWERALGARVRTAAVADERHVYAGLDDDRIVALRLSDGELAWAFRSPNTLWSPPTVAGDTLYLTLRRGDVVALDAASGRERWSTAVGGSFFAAPVVADGVLYVAADEVIAGIEASSGRVLWRVPLDESRVVRAPLVLREHIVVTSGDGLLVFDRRTGVRTFEFPQTNPVGATSDGERVFSVATGFAVAIDPHERLPWWQGLRRLWTQVWIWGLAPLPPRPESLWIGPLRGDRLRGVQVPALGAELLFVADEPGTVRALRLANGGEAWSVQAGRQAGPPTLAADGLLLVGREALSLRSAGDGSELARLPLPAAERRQALVTERALVVLDGEGRVALHAAAP
jgi:outer membrane protein assembly factor BamB